MRVRSLTLFAVALFVVAPISCANNRTEPVQPAPAPLVAPLAIPDESAFAVVVVRDLKTSIARLETVASAFGAPRMNLATILAARCNDPDLAHLGTGPCAIIIAPGMPMPTIAFVIPTTTPDAYATAFGADGTMVKPVGNALVIAQLFDGLELGEKLVPALPTLTTGLSGDLRVLVAPDRLMKTYGAFVGNILTMAQAMTPKEQKNPGAEMVPLVWAGVQAVLADVTTVQVDVTLGDDALAFALTGAAATDSALAKALVAPPATPALAPARLGPDAGMLCMTCRLDPAATSAYVIHLTDTLAKKPECRALLTTERTASMRALFGFISGDSAMRWQFDAQGDSIQQTVQTISDGTTADTLMAFYADNPFGKYLQDLGVTQTFTRNVRTVDGIPVHRIGFTFAPDKAADPALASMHKNLRDAEYAVGGGFAYVSQNAPVDSLIHPPVAEAPRLAAHQAFGPGQQLYLDVDLPRLMAWSAGSMPDPQHPATIGNQPLRAAMLALPPQAPIVMASRQESGLTRTDLHLPVTTLKAVFATFKASLPAPRPPSPPVEHDRPDEVAPVPPSPAPTF